MLEISKTLASPQVDVHAILNQRTFMEFNALAHGFAGQSDYSYSFRRAAIAFASDGGVVAS